MDNPSLHNPSSIHYDDLMFGSVVTIIMSKIRATDLNEQVGTQVVGVIVALLSSSAADETYGAFRDLPSHIPVINSFESNSQLGNFIFSHNALCLPNGGK